MENVLEIWAKICSEIKPTMTELSYKAWISEIEPVILKNGVLVLQVPTKDNMKTISDYYVDNIQDVARRTDSSIQTVLLILPEEKDKYTSAEMPTLREPNSSLNPKYTFDSFIVGASNRFPHAAAMAVASNPGKTYNPLFIYGGVGLGKTHLMQAIGHKILEDKPNAVVTYVTSETFTNELINAIQQDKRTEFRMKYRNVDILMIDDIQFISKSQATQEEFFNTFNTLHDANKQIVISSDRPPKEIQKLEERLCSRFEWGLITDIQPPDLETRIAILRNRAKLDNMSVNDDIILYIAEHVYSNIRELEGCLTRVTAFAQLHGEPLTLSIATEALKDLLPETGIRELTEQVIMETVAEYYSISVETMKSNRRDKDVLIPRQVAMYLCHDLLNYSYQRIALAFDRTDHTTSINACEKVEEMIQEHPSFATCLNDIKKRLG